MGLGTKTCGCTMRKVVTLIFSFQEFLCPLSMTTNIVTEDITEESLTLPDDNPVTVFSPIDFKICPCNVGRLKKRRVEAPSLLKSKRTATEQTNSETDNLTEVRKKRGQPKDSKIRAKIMNHCPKGQCICKRAELATYCELLDDSEICEICGFRFDDPMKKEKKIDKLS